MDSLTKIAILCNYELIPERVGGMDYFFWMFDAKCKENNIHIDWFFPNYSNHGNYSKLNITDCNFRNIENYFLEYVDFDQVEYSHVYTHFIEVCTPFFKKIKKKVNAKIIAVDHNPRPINGYSFKKKIEKKIKGKLYSKYIDLFVSVSEFSKSQLLNEFGKQIVNKVVVIFNGLEINKYILKKDFKFQNQFIVASHLRKDKGIQDLINAVKELQKEKAINFVVDIFGKGCYGDDLKELVNKYSLQHVFNFKGSVDNLHELYGQYDYLIHPSHGETFCFSVVESLMSNLPVITTRNQGNVLKLVVEGRNGFLFPESNVNALKEILYKITTFEKKISDFPKDNESLKTLSLENMVNNYFNLLK